MAWVGGRVVVAGGGVMLMLGRCHPSVMVDGEIPNAHLIASSTQLFLAHHEAHSKTNFEQQERSGIIKHD